MVVFYNKIVYKLQKYLYIKVNTTIGKRIKKENKSSINIKNITPTKNLQKNI